MIEQAVQANPNVLIIPRINITPPKWWTDQHIDQRILKEDYKPLPSLDTLTLNAPSPASDLFIEDVKRQLEIFIRYIHNSPYKDHIIGYQIAYLSFGEWFYPEPNARYVDFSEVNRLKFIQWLKPLYADSIERLNKAWGTTYANFEKVQIPPASEWEVGDDGVFRDPAVPRARRVAEFLTYQNELIASRLDELGQWVKKLTSDRSLAVFFWGYQNELINNGGTRGIGHTGHLALRKGLASPNIDILCSPVSYYDRNPGGPCNMMSITDSIAEAGKIYLQENDSTTYRVDPKKGPFSWIPWYSTKFDTHNCMRRDFGHVLSHNMAMWWMDLGSDGRYDSDDIGDTMRQTLKTYEDSVTHQSGRAMQVALVYDEESYYWLKANSRKLIMPNGHDQRSIFQELGAQVGYYQISDLDKIPSSVKLFVFVNAFHINAKDEAAIKSLKNNGRTLLWLYAPGYVTPTGLSTEKMKELTGFSLKRNSSEMNPALKIIAGDNLVGRSLAGHTFGNSGSENSGPISPTFSGSTSDGVTVLGNYSASGQPGLLLKNFDNWRSIFCGAPELSVPLLRVLAQMADVNLIDDADNAKTADAIDYNGRYLYVYARDHAGPRSFQLPWEKVPNGSFEKYAGTIPTDGPGKWISPFESGSLIKCTIGSGIAHSGVNACRTGSFTSGPNQNSAPIGIRLHGRIGKTYKVSAWIYTDALSAGAAAPIDYILLQIGAGDSKTGSLDLQIAKGSKIKVANKKWTRLSGEYTLTGSQGSQSNDMTIQLRIKGPYSAENIVLDDLSIQESGGYSVTVKDSLTGKVLAKNATGWTADFAKNEQRIFQLLPAQRDK